MPEPAIYDDIPEAEYHADRESLSVSGAKLLLRAPALYQYRLDHPEHRDEFDIGSAAHKLVLGVGPELYDVGQDGFEDWRKAEARQLRDELRELDTIALLPRDFERVHAMAAALQAHSFAVKLIEDSEHELSAYARDPETGVLMRGRIDCLGAVVSDYKTTASAEPFAFARSVTMFGYDMQAAWYLDLLDLLGEGRESFALIAQEKEPPYLVEVYELDELSLERGRRRNRRALEVFEHCTELDEWPGYTGAPYTTLSEPRWALMEEGL